MNVNPIQEMINHLVDVHNLAPWQVQVSRIEEQHEARHASGMGADHSVEDLSYPVSYEMHEA